MINLFIDSRRRSWFKRVLLRAESDETIRIPNDHAEQTVERDLIWSALAGLPRQQRAALVLRYYEDLPDVDIADALGCSVGTARGYISKALATLRSTELVKA